MVEGLLQRIGLQKPVRETQHHINSSPVLFGQLVAVLEQQPSRALEVAALIRWLLFLNAFANIVHGQRAEADDVEAVNDDLRVGETSEKSRSYPEHFGIGALIS